MEQAYREYEESNKVKKQEKQQEELESKQCAQRFLEDEVNGFLTKCESHHHYINDAKKGVKFFVITKTHDANVIAQVKGSDSLIWGSKYKMDIADGTFNNCKFYLRHRREPKCDNFSLVGFYFVAPFLFEHKDVVELCMEYKG